MALCYSLLLLTLLLISVTTAQASDEKEEIIEIDSDEEPEVQPRVARQAPEGSGMWPDYNLDDEDTIVPEYGSTNIVSSRVIPEASSPTAHSERWRPWRGYAANLLWRSLLA